MANKLTSRVDYLQRALSRLEEMLRLPETNEAKLDACVQRFEFTYEMAKKLLAEAVYALGFDVKTPNEMFVLSMQNQLISDLGLWEQMRKDRNDTVHEYDEAKAQEIYARIPSYCEEFQHVLSAAKHVKQP